MCSKEDGTLVEFHLLDKHDTETHLLKKMMVELRGSDNVLVLNQDTCTCVFKAYSLKTEFGSEYAKNWAIEMKSLDKVKADSILKIYPKGFGGDARFRSLEDLPRHASSNPDDERFNTSITSHPSTWYQVDQGPTGTFTDEEAFLASIRKSPRHRLTSAKTLPTTAPPSTCDSQLCDVSDGVEPLNVGVTTTTTPPRTCDSQLFNVSGCFSAKRGVGYDDKDDDKEDDELLNVGVTTTTTTGTKHGKKSRRSTGSSH